MVKTVEAKMYKWFKYIVSTSSSQ